MPLQVLHPGTQLHRSYACIHLYLAPTPLLLPLTTKDLKHNLIWPNWDILRVYPPETHSSGPMHNTYVISSRIIYPITYHTMHIPQTLLLHQSRYIITQKLSQLNPRVTSRYLASKAHLTFTLSPFRLRLGPLGNADALYKPRSAKALILLQLPPTSSKP